MDDVIRSDSGSDIFMKGARELPANRGLVPRRYIRYVTGNRHRQRRRHHQEQGGRRDGHYYRRATVTIPGPILSGASVHSCSTESSRMLTNRERVMKFYGTCRYRSQRSTRLLCASHSGVIDTVSQKDTRQV